jgi:hypothetical protein
VRKKRDRIGMIGFAGMINRIIYHVYHAGEADHVYPVPFFSGSGVAQHYMFRTTRFLIPKMSAFFL